MNGTGNIVVPAENFQTRKVDSCFKKKALSNLLGETPKKHFRKKK